MKKLTILALLIVMLICFNVNANENDIRSIIAIIKTYKENNSQPISDTDLFRIMEESSMQFTEKEYREIWKSFCEAQSPSISSKDLIKILKFKQDLIKTSVQKFHYLETIASPNSGNDFKSNQTVYVDYYSSGPQVFFERKVPSNPSMSYKKSYDGKIVRIVRNAESKDPIASINSYSKPTDFFEMYSPVSMAMLINTKKRFQHAMREFDCMQLFEMGAIVLEKYERHQNMECVVVTDGLSRIFLAPELEYAVIGYENYNPIYSENSGRLLFLKRIHISERVLKDLKDYGNGLWLPTKIEITEYDNGNVRSKVFVDVDDIEINVKIENTVFSDIIPDNAFVSDRVRNISYIYSDRSSIGGLLKDTVQRKTVTIFRWVSVILGIAMIAVGVGFKIRKRMKERKSS